MRNPSFVLLILVALAGCGRPGELVPDRELHVVGVYEGVDPTDIDEREACQQSQFTDDEGTFDRKAQYDCIVKVREGAWTARQESRDEPWPADVSLDRPGKNVVLALGSYECVDWSVTATSETDVESVVLFGYQPDCSRVSVDGVEPGTVTHLEGFDTAYSMRGQQFRDVVERLVPDLGFERMASFTGEYDAPEAGFLVATKDVTSPELQRDWLKDKVVELPDEDEMVIEAMIGGEPGLFRLNGEKVGPLTFVQTGVSSINSARDRIYKIEQNATVIIDGVSNETIASIAPPPETMVISRLEAIALDEAANRVIGAFQSGNSETELLQYDLKARNWSRMATLGRFRVGSLWWCADTQELLMLTQPNNPDYEILRVGADGQSAVIWQAHARELAGLDDLYDPENERPPQLVIAGKAGNRLALAADGQGPIYRFDRPSSFVRIYDLDLGTGEAHLTFYQKPD